MVYLVVVDWPNTKHNHAGMRYLASQVKKLSHNHIRIIAISASYLTCLSKLRLSGLYKIYIFLVGLYLKLITKRDDVVFFDGVSVSCHRNGYNSQAFEK